MNATRFVGLRGTKGRLLLYVGSLLLLGLVIYMYHGAEMQVAELREASQKCQQQHESLSAQLQVIFEYKIRLEKSLQQEKNEHRQTKEDLQSKALEEKLLKDKTVLESMNKYTALQQQHKLLRSQHDDLDEECNKVRISQLQGLEEKSKLESQAQAMQQEIDQIQSARTKEMENLKDKYKSCHRDSEIRSYNKPNPQSITNRTTTAKSTASGIREPNSGPKNEVEKVGLKSTTPQINPEAISAHDRAAASANGANSNVVPMPPPAGQDDLAAAVPLPAGVVPAPPGYVNKLYKPANSHIVQADDNAWAWNYRRPQPQADNNQHDNLLRFQYLNNQRNVDANNHIVNVHNQHHPNMKIHADSNIHNVQLHNQQHVDIHNPHNSDFINEHNLELPNRPDSNNLPDFKNHNDQDFNIHHNLELPDRPDANSLTDFKNQHNGDFNNNNNALNAHKQEGFMNPPRMGMNPHHNAADMANDLLPRGAPLRFHEQQHKNVHGNAPNAYPYHGDYEKDAQRNDLHLEEAEEEGDDDVDQIDYGNDGAKQHNLMDVVQRPGLNQEEHRDGVMVNPK